MYTTTLDTTLVSLFFFSKKPHASAILLFAYSTPRPAFLAVIHCEEDSLLLGVVDV
jgi:hypothetical protein